VQQSRGVAVGTASVVFLDSLGTNFVAKPMHVLPLFTHAGVLVMLLIRLVSGYSPDTRSCVPSPRRVGVREANGRWPRHPRLGRQ